MVIPMGTSARPVFLIFPVRANTFVPLLRSVPTLAYSSAPSRKMVGTLAYVSTLFKQVGLPQRPEFAGKGGRGRGIPRKPSMDANRAVSSPHTKAPAPSLIFKSKQKSVPRIFLPR